MATSVTSDRPSMRPNRAVVSNAASARMTGWQRLVAFLLLGAGFMLSVAFSTLNVALPQLGAGVGLELSALSWMVRFPDNRRRALVLGVNGALLSGGFTVGALAGGTLVGVLNRATAPLVAVGILLPPTVRWDNLAGLIVFSMESVTPDRASGTGEPDTAESSTNLFAA